MNSVFSLILQHFESDVNIKLKCSPPITKNHLHCLCYDEFTRLYSQTVGADFYIKRIALPKKQEITLRITDIGGLELRGSMLDKYLFKSDVRNFFFSSHTTFKTFAGAFRS